jgi:hypothetical protein
VIVSRQVLRFAWYRLQATFGRRWVDYLAVVLLIGLIGGVAMGAVAGARRTESSFPTYLASTNPSTVMVFAGFNNPNLGVTTGYDSGVIRRIAHLPLVTHSATSVGFDGNIDLTAVTGVHPHYFPGETPPEFIGGLDGEYSTQDRVTLVVGRLSDPKRPDEAVMDAQAAKELGLHVGSVIHVPFYTDAEQNSASYNGPPFKVAKVKMVGVVVFSTSVVQDDIAALGSGKVLLSAALTRELAPCCAYYSGNALQVVGDHTDAERVVRGEAAQVTPIAALGIGGGSRPAAVVTQAQRAITPEAIAQACSAASQASPSC